MLKIITQSRMKLGSNWMQFKFGIIDTKKLGIVFIAITTFLLAACGAAEMSSGILSEILTYG